MAMTGTVAQHDPMTALWLLVCDLERAWLPPYPDSEEFYGYEPYPIALFLDRMAKVKETVEAKTHASGTNGRFLDVGCGIGTKLLLARYLGWSDVTGIELRPEYADIAGRLCPEADIEIADALTWDRYGDFDVIYMYRPCISDTLERALEERVLAYAAPGTVTVFGQPITNGGDIRCPIRQGGPER